MSSSNVTPRLEAHRLKWIKQEKKGSLLPFHELSDQERQFFIEELTQNVKIRRLNVDDSSDELFYDRMLLDLLNDWGVMCAHPSSAVKKKKKSFYCNVCGCHIIGVKKIVSKVNP